MSYRALKRQLALDDDYLEDLKDELIDAQRLASYEDGKVLVGMGDTAPTPPTLKPKPIPLAYTPPHFMEKILTLRSSLEGERKQVTVLFADIKGSTELIHNLDPEQAWAILDPALHTMMEAVDCYEGTVNQGLSERTCNLSG